MKTRTVVITRKIGWGRMTTNVLYNGEAPPFGGATRWGELGPTRVAKAPTPVCIFKGASCQECRVSSDTPTVV